MPITPSGHHDARSFTDEFPDAPEAREQLEALRDHLRRLTTDSPHATGGAGEVTRVFTFIASGLDHFLEDHPDQAWGTLTRARLWIVDHAQQASAVLPQPDIEALHAAMATPHLSLAEWVESQRQAEQIIEAAHLAAWWAASDAVQEMPFLEGGAAEDTLDATLTAFFEPKASAISTLN